MKDLLKGIRSSFAGNVRSCNMTINGKAYRNINGSISVQGNKVFVNGRPIEDLEQMEEKNISITITGEVSSLSADCCDTIHVDGNVGKIRTTSGDVEVSGRVDGDIQTTSGDINCSDVTGDVSTTSGDVICDRVGGGVSTMSGNIRHR